MVSKTNTRRDAFRAIYAVLNTNKPSGWYIRSIFPNVDTEFPVILIYPVEKNIEVWSNDGTNSSDDIMIKVDVIVHMDSAPAVLDTGRDYVTDEIQSNVSSFFTSYNLDLLGIDDSGTSNEDVNDQMYLVASFNVRFRRV